jgi:CRP/FNR family transcriptional regulator, cyclic AMP receptor protein
MSAPQPDLSRCSLLQDMTPSEIEEVLELCEPRTYPAGTTILKEGKSVQYLWIVLRGTCRVVKSMKTGGEQELARLEAGAVFGEMSFFNPAPHSASVITVTEVEVMRLPRDRFDRLELTGSRAAYKITRNTARTLAERLRRMDQWTGELVEKPEAAGHREEWREFRSKLYSDWGF